jgi:exopolysaccharide production protein ExoQ
MLVIRLVATAIWALLTWQLYRLNREPDARPSKALWIPAFWLFIASSRNVSAWLQYSSGAQSDQYLEGSPLDRAVLTTVLALGVIVLIHRRQRVWTILQSSLPILIYFLYCGISVAWSDFPDVSFKRWFRALGDVVMVLIVLSDRDWVVAFRRLLARVGIILVPLSILFIRYYPDLGRSYSSGGTPFWTGVATDKNALGMLCMIFGLAAIIRFLQLRREEASPETKRQKIAQAAIVLMTFYLLWEANSATAFSCFFLAGIPMVLTYLFRFARKPAFVHLMVASALVVSSSALFLGIGSNLVQDLGRDSTLTGRTAIWTAALGMVRNPLLGAGFESFWLGERLAGVEKAINQGVNQAHNGYIEIYLNLGWVGVALLGLILVTGYFRVVKGVRLQTPASSLCLAYFIATVAYNFTEAGFKMTHPVWIVFLLAIMIVPRILVPKDQQAARDPEPGRFPIPPSAARHVSDPTSSEREPVRLAHMNPGRGAMPPVTNLVRRPIRGVVSHLSPACTSGQ